MRHLTAIFLTLIFLMIVSIAMAAQEVKDAAIVDYDMNHDDKVCTITIDRDVQTDGSTEKCTPRAFSWKCLNDDYLWHMVLHIHKNQLPIDIRYSSEECFDDSIKNLKLLTIGSVYFLIS